MEPLSIPCVASKQKRMHEPSVVLAKLVSKGFGMVIGTFKHSMTKKRLIKRILGGFFWSGTLSFLTMVP